MLDFSIKMAWLNKILGGIILLVATTSWAAPSKGPVQSYRVRLRTQQGYFLNKPMSDLATSRLYFDVEQRSKRHSSLAGVSQRTVESRGCLRTKPKPISQAMSDNESVELELRDTYLHLSGAGFSARLGMQTVVWGETFGFFYADVGEPQRLA